MNSSFSLNKTKLNSVEENQIGGNKHEALQNDATLLDVRACARPGPAHHGERWPIKKGSNL